MMFNCSFENCDFASEYKGNLKTHIKHVHDKIKDFKCDKCEYKTSRNDNLKTHIKQVHDKIKDFKCNNCEYITSTSMNLKAHIKMVHDKIKDFKCDKCEYETSTNGSLKTHIKIVHDKIKDFKCDKCRYETAVSGDLKKHKIICTGNLKISAGELKIKNALNSMEINYVFDATFEPLSRECKQNLRFDFYVSEFKTFIEFNGMQHYEPVRFGGISAEDAKSKFEKQIRNDNIKKEFCERNGYNLLIIKFNEFLNVDTILFEYFSAKGWDSDERR